MEDGKMPRQRSKKGCFHDGVTVLHLKKLYILFWGGGGLLVFAGICVLRHFCSMSFLIGWDLILCFR